MQVEAVKRFGRIEVLGAYRTYEGQVYFWNLYRSGRGNLAARPGTSNHGWGLAIDLKGHRSRWIVDQIGAKYGFSKSWSDAPGEWWHIKFKPGVWKDTPAVPILRWKSGGPRVRSLQVRLRKLGFKSVPGPHEDGYGYYGETTVSAVKRFQQAHKLHPDGRVGPKTAAALKRAAP
jgi:hypothetical protein